MINKKVPQVVKPIQFQDVRIWGDSNLKSQSAQIPSMQGATLQ